MARTFQEKYGPWAIVAGAAEGLGEAYCIALAKQQMNIVLVDHHLESANDLCQRLENKYGIETKRVHLDLSASDAVESIREITKLLDIHLLIYNAAYSLIKPFVHHSSSELDRFIAVNAQTQIKLVHAFSKRLIQEKKTGGIILMSSLSGLIGMQLIAPYAATKAFAWNLAEALHFEFKQHGIDVMACVAGATSTAAYLQTKPTYGLFKPAVMKPEDVAEKTLMQLGRKARFIPGKSNRFNYFVLTRLLPRKIAAAMANRTMLSMYKHKSDLKYK